MRVSCFKGYSLCIFIVFSCIGILTDCLLFLVIYSFMDICGTFIKYYKISQLIYFLETFTEYPYM